LERDDPEIRAEIRARIEELRLEAPAAEARRQQIREDERHEAQAEEVGEWESWDVLNRRHRGSDVWLYHGTSTAVLDDILRHGLHPDVARHVHMDATEGFVYLTARGAGPGSAEYYARRASSVLGGDPVVLRVIVAWDDLEPDPDDQDISTGRYQYVTRAPVRVMEVDGTRLTQRSTAPRLRPNRLHLDVDTVQEVARGAVDDLIVYLANHWTNDPAATVEVDGAEFSTRNLRRQWDSGILTGFPVQGIPGLLCRDTQGIWWVSKFEERVEGWTFERKYVASGMFQPPTQRDATCVITLRLFWDITPAELAQHQEEFLEEATDVLLHEITHATDLHALHIPKRAVAAMQEAEAEYFNLPWELRARSQQWAIKIAKHIALLRSKKGTREGEIEGTYDLVGNSFAWVLDDAYAWQRLRPDNQRAVLKWIYQWLDERGILNPENGGR
jgi:hypothetical protein